MAAPDPSLRDQLALLAGLDDVDLAGTAFLLGHFLDQPCDIQAGFQRLDKLAAELDPAETDPLAQAGFLAALLAGRHGFAAVDSDDPEHANLSEMLECREGSAEALGILWIEVARRAGWTADALAFPGGFVLRLEGERGRRVLVDPSAGGVPVEPQDLRAVLKALAGLSAELEPAHFLPLSNRDILLRLQNEEKLRRLRRGRIAEAVQLVESMLLFAPDRDDLWRESGMMHLRLDHTAQAIAALEQYVARADNSAQRRRTLMLLQDLKSRQN